MSLHPIRRRGVLVAMAVLGAGGARAGAPCCGPITPAGERLARVLDGMDVTHRWLAREHVDWRTGLEDRRADGPGPEGSGPDRATHCSAFAAAVGLRLGVYMLRPPEHGQTLLASAQTRWFAEPGGVAAGWRAVDSMEDAQGFANRGLLVVIAYANPDRHRPGHIVVVRPSLKSPGALARGGPQVIQAASVNKVSYPAARSFLAHPHAWSSGAVRSFVHDVG